MAKFTIYIAPSARLVSLSSHRRILSASLSFGQSGKAGNDIIDNEYDEAF